MEVLKLEEFMYKIIKPLDGRLERTHMNRYLFYFSLCFWILPIQAETPDSKDLLNVPSPAWQDQIIYFLMIDRFCDGDSQNNDQGCEEYDPNNTAKYSGGDLRGILQKLDYVRDLGATALWITPPVSHQWWDPLVRYGGYHGYWFSNLQEIDKHFGTLQDYRGFVTGNNFIDK